MNKPRAPVVGIGIGGLATILKDPVPGFEPSDGIVMAEPAGRRGSSRLPTTSPASCSTTAATTRTRSSGIRPSSRCAERSVPSRQDPCSGTSWTSSSPGSDIYLVYDEVRRDPQGLAEYRDRRLILKLTHLMSR